ncbi:MAG: alpha-L-arabinofuranosidase C-terminal domain-containing protein [Bryobacteraceae bacterium]
MSRTFVRTTVEYAVALGLAGLVLAGVTRKSVLKQESAGIDVDASKPIGNVSKYLFGQNVEHEHGAISGGEQNMFSEHGFHSGGLWAEMLRDRKFEEGDVDADGVANGWVPEERVTNRYEELVNGRGPTRLYRVDHHEFYGGGAAQAMEISGAQDNHASIYQVGLHFSKGRRYTFYTYLKRSGTGPAWVEFSALGKPAYARQEFPNVSERWVRFAAEFTAPEDTNHGRVRIGGQGAGVLWVDSASLMPADNLRGMRADVVAAMKPLEVPLVRYPGGCFADTYHWKDGVGDRDKRPERWSPMWNEWEPNDFGTDEFMDLARELGFDTHITLNYLSGTEQEAAEWVQYVNGPAGSPMGSWRARNGHPQPYVIKLWAVGNESEELCSDEFIGANDVNRYAARYKEYRDLILKQDPSVTVMAVGAGPGPLKWNHDLAQLAPVDLLGVSIYTGERSANNDLDTRIMDLNHFYRNVVAEPVDFERQLQAVVESVGESFLDRPKLAVTEFQAWWLTERTDADLRLADALYIAGVYHNLFRRARQVYIAEIESLLNVQGIIEANQTSVKLTPEYFACLLYRKHTGATVLSTSTKSPMASFNAKLPLLDAVATISSDKRTLYLSVVNRAEDQDVNARVRIQGWTAREGADAAVLELNGKDKVAANPFGSTDNVNIRNRSIKVAGPGISYKFPAHSVTVIELPAAD